MAFRRRRPISSLALVVSLFFLALDGGHGDAESLVESYSTTTPPTTTTLVRGDVPVTGSGSRVVVRIGAFFFALGGIVSYVAAGTRRRP